MTRSLKGVSAPGALFFLTFLLLLNSVIAGPLRSQTVDSDGDLEPTWISRSHSISLIANPLHPISDALKYATVNLPNHSRPVGKGDDWATSIPTMPAETSAKSSLEKPWMVASVPLPSKADAAKPHPATVSVPDLQDRAAYSGTLIFELNCGRQPGDTEFCAAMPLGYYCSGDGSVRWNNMIMTYCRTDCRCLVADAAAALTPSEKPSRQVFSRQVLSARSTTKNYALVCSNNHDLTRFCQHTPRGYGCDATGTVHFKGHGSTYCSNNCECRDLGPTKTHTCLVPEMRLIPCAVTEGVVTDDAGKHLARLEDAPVLTNGTLDLTDLDSTHGTANVDARDVLDARHDFAMVCSNDRFFTAWCARPPRRYFCDQGGRLNQHVVVGDTDRAPRCAAHCKCASTRGRGKATAVCYSQARIVPAGCWVRRSGSIVDLSDQTIGDMDHAVWNDNGTIRLLDSDTGVQHKGKAVPAAVLSRDVAAAQVHDYAIVCDTDRKATAICSSAPYRFSCDKKARLVAPPFKEKPGISFDVYEWCDLHCDCIDMMPRSCVLVSSFIWTHCVVQMDGAITDTTGKVIGHQDSAVSLANGTMVIPAVAPSSNSLVTRDVTAAALTHDWAIVCEEDRGLTKACSSAPFLFSCNSKGTLTAPANKIPEISEEYDWCKKNCRCINMKPSSCILIPALLGTKCMVHMDGSITNEEGTLIGYEDSVHKLENGILILPALLDRRSASDLVLSKADTVDGPSAALVSKRAEMHSYALWCDTVTLSRTCMSRPYKYNCDARGRLTREEGDLLCEASCSCNKIASLDLTHCFVSPFPWGGTMCAVANGIVYNTKGNLIGDLGDADVLEDGTLDFSKGIVLRELSSRHNYALFCLNQKTTRTCMNSPYKYNCDADATVVYSRKESTCSGVCKCNKIALYGDDPLSLSLEEPAFELPHCIISTYPWAGTICARSRDVIINVRNTFLGSVDDLEALESPALSIYIQPLSKEFTQGESAKSGSDLVSRQVDYGAMLCEDDNDNISNSWIKHCKDEFSYHCEVKNKVNTLVWKEEDKECSKRCSCPATLSQAASFLAERTAEHEPKLALDSNQVLHNGKEPRTTTLDEPKSQPVTQQTIEEGELPPFAELECFSNDPAYVGYNQALTRKCSEIGYTCYQVSQLSYPQLVKPISKDMSCEVACWCPNVYTFTVPKGNLTDNLTSKVGVDSRQDPFDGPVAKPVDVREAAYGPPRNQTWNPSPDFQLDCGHRVEWAGYCTAEELGFFCQEVGGRGVVARNSTNIDSQVTWCDQYCSCISTHPSHCINERSVPWCIELPDGTVRDAFNLDTVLARVWEVYRMENGTILIDREPHPMTEAVRH